MDSFVIAFLLGMGVAYLAKIAKAQEGKK